MTNIDYEAIIKSAKESGQSLEDIAKQFSAAMNAFEDEELQKKNGTYERDQYIDYLWGLFAQHYEEEHFDFDDAAALLTIIAATDEELGKNWTKKDCEDHYSLLRKNLRESVKRYNLLKKANEKLDEVVERIDETRAKVMADRKNGEIDPKGIIESFLRMFD